MVKLDESVAKFERGLFASMLIGGGGPLSGPIGTRVRVAGMAAMVASALRSRGLDLLEFIACLFHVKRPLGCFT
ncbi:hypothetical protein [Streptomyces sp. MS2.AVA.5]|uniref:Uncharacterized protein n=1 Tax=Streptomyces achmelvichensis TaxID=3134111 RepID=A0ACC6PXF6_9ACTN